jgi:CheY-like chemotaxis protein
MATDRLDWQNPKSWQVLAVDDEPDNLDVITIFLKFQGASVKTARNGVEGLALLDSFTPNLILLDLSMPQMDGWEMLAKLRARPDTCRVHIVALTAHAMARDRERVQQVGFNGYVTKPINMPTLLDDLRESGFASESIVPPSAPAPVPAAVVRPPTPAAPAPEVIPAGQPVPVSLPAADHATVPLPEVAVSAPAVSVALAAELLNASRETPPVSETDKSAEPKTPVQKSAEPVANNGSVPDSAHDQPTVN